MRRLVLVLALCGGGTAAGVLAGAPRLAAQPPPYGTTPTGTTTTTTGPTTTTTGPTTTPKPSGPRLEGMFTMTGIVTAAVGIPDERTGQIVTRAWTFAPTCPAGSCVHVRLIRVRAGGSDRVLLKRTSPRHYTGTGLFYAPVKCGTRAVTRGQRVPFRISIFITAMTNGSAGLTAAAMRAAYINAARTNLTRCVAVPAHDAATYRGVLTPPAPPPPPTTTTTGPPPAGS